MMSQFYGPSPSGRDAAFGVADDIPLGGVESPGLDNPDQG